MTQNYLTQSDHIRLKAMNAKACVEGKPPVRNPYFTYYTVVYDRNNVNVTGCQVDPLSYASGETATILDIGNLNFKKHRFDGWNSEKNGGGVFYVAGAKLNVYQNTALYAQWIETYRVFYNKNYSSATGGQIDLTERIQGENALVLDGGSIRFPFNIGSYYWNTRADDTGTRYDPGGTLNVAGDVTLYLIATVFIIYSKNASGATNPPVDGYFYNIGDRVIILDQETMVYSHHNFLGWYEENGLSYQPGVEIILSKSLYLKAQWQPILYRIFYDKNNPNATGEQTDPTERLAGETAIVLDKGTITLPQLQFMGWYEENGLSYQPGVEIFVSRSLYLKAQWQFMFFRIYYDKNNPLATGEQTDPTERLAGFPATVLNKGTLSFTKHRFMGWYEENGDTYQPEVEIFVYRSLYLKAQWQETFRVFYDKNNPLATGDQTDPTERIAGESAIVLDKGTIIASPIDYTSYYWSNVPSGLGNNFLVGDPILVVGDVTLYLRNDVNVLPIPNLFYSKNNVDATGFQVDNNRYNPNDYVVILNKGTINDPTRTFLYWTNRIAYQIFFPGTTVLFSRIDPNNTGQATLYAVWNSETEPEP